MAQKFRSKHTSKMANKPIGVRFKAGPILGARNGHAWRFGAMTDKSGQVILERIASTFGMAKAQVAETAGLKLSSIHKSERLLASGSQAKMREMLEIIGRVADWAGGENQAMAWYRSEPIPAFGGRTAESLVKDGKSASLRDYLDSIAMGGFA